MKSKGRILHSIKREQTKGGGKLPLFMWQKLLFSKLMRNLPGLKERRKKMNDKELRVALEDIVTDQFVYYAHTSDNGGPKETLQEHTDLCCRYWEKLMKDKNLESIIKHIAVLFFPGEEAREASNLFWKMAVNVVNLHDIGKVNPLFQARIMNHRIKIKAEPFVPFKTQHSMLSAICYFSIFSEEIKKISEKSQKECLRHFLFINSYIIARHHSNLNEFEAFLKKFQDASSDGSVAGAVSELSKESGDLFRIKFFPAQMIKWKRIEKKFCEEITCEMAADFYAYTKLMYSLLVACDYYATTEFRTKIPMNQFGCVQDIGKIQREFEQTKVNQAIRCYEKEKYGKEEAGRRAEDINVLRSELFLDTEAELKKHRERQIFYLEAPTGSGKSNTAFQLSFQMISQDPELRKIYYVYPFNTLVEQNYKTLQDTFGKDGEVLHEVGVINSLTPIQVKDGLYEKGLLNREFLNFPIVMTTSVSFFQILFGEQQENLFAFHQLCNSVVVLDEIQNYKSLIWPEIITFFTALSKLLHMKFIIMSATLPALSRVSKILGETVNLVPDRKKYFEHVLFRDRVRVNYELLTGWIQLEELYAHVRTREKCKKKILIEFITKKSAYQFYEVLCNGKENGEIQSEIALMTGDNNGLEREELLHKITHFTCEEKGFILAATQVVEAGMDIDMDIGYKDISKVDSEEQFMGRVNRSCKREGEVFFFHHDSMKRIYGNDYRGNEEFSLLNDKMKEILRSKNFEEFYGCILEMAEQRGKEQNQNNLDAFFQDCVGKLNFLEIAQRMRLIEEDDWSMSVYLAHVVKNKDGEEFDGKAIWEQYKMLLLDESQPYAKRQVLLSEVRCKMNYFMYRVKKNPVVCTEVLGDIFYFEDGEKYFENGRLLKEKLEGDRIDFIDI